jgi:hypothetical protein
LEIPVAPPRKRTKTIKIEFYRVVMPASRPSLTEVIAAVAKLPKDAARTKTVNGVPVRLHDSGAAETHRMSGELLRIRMDVAPARASMKGPVGDFDFGSDEGFGEETAFLYDSRYEILVLQRNYIGVSASSFAGYFQQFGGVRGDIVLKPVIDPSTTAKFNKLATIRQLEVSVAGITNAETIKKQNPGVSVKRFNELVEYFGAQAVHVYLSMGHQPGSLSKAKTAAKQFLKLSQDEHVDVRKVELSGRTSDEDALVVDLLRDRLIEEAEISVNTKRRLPYSERHAALEAAYARQDSQLISLFDSNVRDAS